MSDVVMIMPVVLPTLMLGPVVELIPNSAKRYIRKHWLPLELSDEAFPAESTQQDKYAQ